MNYKAIGFDYGGVIYGLPGKLFDQKIAALLGVDVDRYRKAYFTHNTKHIDTQEMWQLVLAELQKEQFNAEVEQFTKEWSSSKIIQSGVMELIDRLKDKDYKVGLLTNRSREQAIKLRSSGITDNFDVVCISSEIGCAKPEPEAFKIFCDELGVKPQELIFIDDEATSLSTAKEIGYDPVLFGSYEGLVKKLEALSVI